MTSGRRFIPEVDGLRFFASSGVVLFHLSAYTCAQHMSAAAMRHALASLARDSRDRLSREALDGRFQLLESLLHRSAGNPADRAIGGDRFLFADREALHGPRLGSKARRQIPPAKTFNPRCSCLTLPANARTKRVPQVRGDPLLPTRLTSLPGFSVREWQHRLLSPTHAETRKTPVV